MSVFSRELFDNEHECTKYFTHVLLFFSFLFLNTFSCSSSLLFSTLGSCYFHTLFLLPPFFASFFFFSFSYFHPFFFFSFFSHVELLMQGLVHLSNTVLVRRKLAKGGFVKRQKDNGFISFQW